MTGDGFKRALLGRSRLERKSRLWMALVLSVVIGGSFYWVARRTRGQLFQKMQEKAALVADAVLAQRAAEARAMRTLNGRPELFPHPLEQRRAGPEGFSWRHIYPGARFQTSRPRRPYEEKLLQRWSQSDQRQSKGLVVKDPMTGERLYQWLTPVTADDSCLTCHPEFTPGSFQGMLSVELPFDRELKTLRYNKLLMTASAVLTLAVALGTLYLLTRHLIIEPLHHLKETTDRVAAGDLQARAHLRTGDELEEFADALNHMIENVQHTHQALAELNRNLDAQLDALGRANLELHEMNQLRTEFLASMSHELRSPLHSVLGFAQVLLEEHYGPLNPRQRRYLKNILSSGRDLLDLINNLLDMSRLEAGRMQKNLDQVSLAELVNSVVAKLEPLRGEGLTVSVEVPEGLPPVVIDPRKTARILSNLLSNAYKFTPDGGRVRVQAAVQDDRVVLTVSDTGIGIPESELPKVFDKFRQVEPGKARQLEGSGLGLAIVRELTRFLGGEVTVRSRPGEGSTFTVTLPVGSGVGSKAGSKEPEEVFFDGPPPRAPGPPAGE